MSEPRTSPLFSQIVLWIAFALVVVASIFTVVVPELTDESEDEGSAQNASDPAPADDAQPAP